MSLTSIEYCLDACSKRFCELAEKCIWDALYQNMSQELSDVQQALEDSSLVNSSSNSDNEFV